LKVRQTFVGQTREDLRFSILDSLDGMKAMIAKAVVKELIVAESVGISESLGILVVHFLGRDPFPHDLL